MELRIHVTKQFNFDLKGMDPSDAILTVLNGMSSKIPNADGGAIAITKDGIIGFNWNSEQMGWAYVKKSEMSIHYGVNRGDDFTQPFDNTTISKPIKCTKFETCYNRFTMIVKDMLLKIINIFG